MNRTKYFMFNPIFRLFAPVVYGVFVYLLILLINNTIAQVDELFIGQEVYICIGLSLISFESTRFVIVVLRKVSVTNKTLKIILQIGVSTLVSLLLVVVGLTQYFNYVVGFSIAATQLMLFSMIYLVTAILYNLLYYSNYYLNLENTIKIATEKQQRDVLEMEIAEFKNDINPDLLYESLENTIALMYSNRDKAEEYIDCLAATYRYSLSNQHQELIAIQAEIQAAQNLLFLLNEKFNQKITFTINPEVIKSNVMLIPGSLPIALEYLIRTTIISHHSPMNISCYLEDKDYIVLQSKLNDKLLLDSTSVHAFSRLQKSYALYDDNPMIQVKAYDENYIKFPVLKIAQEVEVN